MREILFRGKWIDKGEWVYGAYYGLCRITNKAGGFEYEHLMRQSNNEPLYMVDPETVGQYIGLTDKNGKKIFEGDIVRYRDECVVVVVFESGRFLVKCSEFVFSFTPDDCTYIEVIGTIYDNPELLEVE